MNGLVTIARAIIVCGAIYSKNKSTSLEETRNSQLIGALGIGLVSISMVVS